jgi:hypothetical protein
MQLRCLWLLKQRELVDRAVSFVCVLLEIIVNPSCGSCKSPCCSRTWDGIDHGSLGWYRMVLETVCLAYSAHP